MKKRGDEVALMRQIPEMILKLLDAFVTFGTILEVSRFLKLQEYDWFIVVPKVHSEVGC